MPPKKRYTKKEISNILPFKILSTNKKINFKKEGYTIGAIDPALKNCAVRIEGPDKKTIYQNKFKFVEKVSDKNSSYPIIIDTFKGIEKELKKCDFILIECQHHRNQDMLRVEQTILTSLLFLNLSSLIIQVEARIKSSVLFMKEEGIPHPMKKPELKKWSSKKGLEILVKKNDDSVFCDKIKNLKKLDDHCDVILYTYCWRECFLKEYKNVLIS